MDVPPLSPDALRDALAPLDAPLPPLGGRPSAVLLLLFPGASGPEFILTLRQPHLNRHAGQVSLPGGAVDPGDRDLWHTALRETSEELSVDGSLVLPLGRLDVETVRATGYDIVPFVGWLDRAPVLRPNEEEVAAVARVPLAAICDTTKVVDEVWTLRGAPYVVVFYTFGDLAVWGATARILSRFAERLGCTFDTVPGTVHLLTS
ncbi:MAG TPA: CoA pyrophosphatase [Chloroflexota bacterium]|nr:CoA pyrophosphatase [Chloroflexota bacterium]